eukprot:392768_1
MWSTSLAEELYWKSDTKNYETPPLWLDLVFIVTMAIVHIYYAFHFTRFSLSYLNAKCEEKRALSIWSPTTIYIKTVSSYYNKSIKKTKGNQDIDTQIWTQFQILRNVLRVIMFVLCWIVLILYITLAINILFEFLFACLQSAASLLALIVLPPYVFINTFIIRHIFNGIMCTWSINADLIADAIADEQKSTRAKKDALKSTVHISTIAHGDERSITRMFTDTSSANGTTPKQETKELIKQTFFCPYFMAVRWRLCVVALSVLFTLIALPAMSFTVGDELITDQFWFQLFLRYMVFGVIIWFIIFFMWEAVFGLFGRLSSLAVYSDINDGDKASASAKTLKRIRTCREVMRLLCLLDAFGLSDTSRAWKRCKIASILFILIFGILLVLIGVVMESGLVWFVGSVFLVYYAANLMLTAKPSGIRHLWKGNVIALEFDLDMRERTNTTADLAALNIPALSHAAGMTHLKERHLKRLLSRHHSLCVNADDGVRATNTQIVTFSDITPAPIPMVAVKSISTEIGPPDMDKDILSLHQPNAAPKPVTSVTEHADEEHRDSACDFQRQFTQFRADSVAHSEGDVMDIFCRLYNKVYQERNALYKAREDRSALYRVRAINCRLVKNYFYSIFKVYKAYWLLILPYNYDLRPLSFCPSHGSMIENIIKYDYKTHTCSHHISKAILSIWNGTKGMIFLFSTMGVLLLILWLSLRIANPGDTTMQDQLALLRELGVNNTVTGCSGYSVLCHMRWNADLSVLDLMSLAHITHDVAKRDDIIPMEDQVCLYFNGHVAECPWKVIHTSEEEPIFMHVRHVSTHTDVIAIRGTETTLDSLQDFNLFNQVMLLQAASLIVPVTSLLPWSFIIQIVYYMSFFEGTIDTQSRQRYDTPVFEYAYDLLLNTEDTIDSLYFVGHSLGGAVSQAVAAQLYHAFHAGYIENPVLSHNLDLRSLSFGSPGMTFNSRKFSVDLDDLYATATVLKVSHDAISNVDVPAGFVQNVECSESTFYRCHKRSNIICELGRQCGFNNAKNPELISNMCFNMTRGDKASYVFYMKQLYDEQTQNETFF